MAAETIGFAVQPEDKQLLDHLVQVYGNGNRSAFLREAIRVMAARERAERLDRLRESGQSDMIATHGRRLDAAELNAITRASVKGKLPEPAELAALDPMIQERLHRIIAERRSSAETTE